MAITGAGGGSGTSADNAGVLIRNLGGLVTAGGTGAVTIDGTGGNTSGTINRGVYLQSGVVVSSSGGNVRITGHGGGTGGSEDGVDVLSSAQVTAGGGGSVTIDGFGSASATGSQSYGVQVNGATVTSSGGDVTATGQGGGTGAAFNSQGVIVSNAGVITAGGMGSVTVWGTGVVASGLQNSGVFVTRGSSTRITSSGGDVLVVGQGGGTGTSGGNHGVLVATAAQVLAGGAGTVTSGTVQAPNPGIDVTASTVGFGPGTTIRTAINGRIANSDYLHLWVDGAVDLAGPSLSLLTGTYTPIPGDAFTLVTATGPLTGTFDGLPEGATITYRGVPLRISYADGHNAVLTRVVTSPTTTAVTAPDVTYNANGTVTVAVSSSGGTPTGTVQLSLDGGAPLSATLASGSATFTLTSPAAGNHALVATYAAQGNFLGSSASGTLHVNPAATAVTIDVTAVTYNADGTANVTVTSAAGTPGGTVTLSVDGGAPQTQPLSAGSATFTVPSPAAGPHGLHAEYPAQGNFAASSADATLNVAQSPTAVSLAAPTVTYNANGTVTVAVSAPAGVPTPTGTVTRVVNGGAPLSATLSGGSATFTLTSPNAGDYALHAAFAPQGNYAGSSADGTLHVNPAATTTAVSAPDVTYNANGTVTVTVAAPVGVPAPVGTVALSVDGGGPLSAALSGGSATFTLTSPGAGLHTLNAVFAAQGNYAGSSAGGTIRVNPAATTSAIAAPAITYGQAGGVTVTVSSAAGAPGGTVSLSVDGGAAVSAALSGGSATFTLPGRAAGDHALVSTYVSQGNFAGSTGAGTLTVNRAALTVTGDGKTKVYGAPLPTLTGTLSGVVAGDAIAVSYDTAATAESDVVAGGYAITATLIDPAGRLDNYAVTITPGTLTITPAGQTITWATPADVVYGTPLGAAQLDATVSVVGPAPAGARSYDVSAGDVPHAGSHTLTVTAAATVNYNAASRSVTLVVLRATPRVVVTPVAATYDGQGHGTTAQAVGVGGADLGPVPVSYGGGAAPVHPGPYTATGSFAGGDDYAAATGTATVAITPAPLTVTVGDAARVYGAANPAFSVTYAGFVNGETVAALGGSLSFGTAATATSSVGPYPITASGLSSADYALTYQAGTLTVTKAAAAVGVSVSAAAPLHGVDGITLTSAVSVVAPGSGFATGSVTFYDGATPLGTVTVVSGVASLALGATALPTGSRTIQAVYDGDGNFLGSSSTTSVTVLAPSWVQGLVYVDADNDGDVDAGEAGVGGVTVTLTGHDDRGQSVTRTAVTDANGIYAFANLRPSDAAGYTLTEAQPAGLADGRDTVGVVAGVPTGAAAATDTFTGVVLAGSGAVGENYNFGERASAGQAVGAGEAAGIGFWQNKNGQALIKSLNGGPTAMQLGNWLAATFPNMYGSLVGKTNAEVAGFYKVLFARTAQTSPGGPPKTDAQVMAVVLAVYVTNQSLGGSAGATYGFAVTADGLGARTFNVGSNGAAFGVANNTTPTVMSLLLAVNASSRNGLLYGTDGSGQISGPEAVLRTMANDVCSAINEVGGLLPRRESCSPMPC